MNGNVMSFGTDIPYEPLKTWSVSYASTGTCIPVLVLTRRVPLYQDLTGAGQ